VEAREALRAKVVVELSVSAPSVRFAETESANVALAEDWSPDSVILPKACKANVAVEPIVSLASVTDKTAEIVDPRVAVDESWSIPSVTLKDARSARVDVALTVSGCSVVDRAAARANVAVDAIVSAFSVEDREA
jgi:metal-sulfur cluster biosynthetic enzyme